jgi:hypothetical protein
MSPKWRCLWTREKLKKVKKDLDAKSIDSVVNWLLDKHLDQGDAGYGGRRS